MQESPDKLSVYARIGTGDVPNCCCCRCKYCNARDASEIAIDRLVSLIPDNPPLALAIRIARTLLSPGRKDTSVLVRYLLVEFEEGATEKMLQAATEFRRCETAEEALEVSGNFPITTAA